MFCTIHTEIWIYKQLKMPNADLAYLWAFQAKYATSHGLHDSVAWHTPIPHCLQTSRQPSCQEWLSEKDEMNLIWSTWKFYAWNFICLTFSSRKRRYSLPKVPSGKADIWERSNVDRRILGRSLEAKYQNKDSCKWLWIIKNIETCCTKSVLDFIHVSLRLVWENSQLNRVFRLKKMFLLLFTGYQLTLNA